MSDLSSGYVLICHAPDDRDYARDLARQLTDRRIRARYDERGAAVEQLLKLARRADALLVLMTRAAHDCEPLTEQTEAARSLDIPIYPLAVDDNQPLMELTDKELWRTTRGQRLADNLLQALATDVDAPAAKQRAGFGLPVVLGAAAGAMVVAVVATVLLLGRDNKTDDPPPAAAETRTAAPASPGQVIIASPADGSAVKKCQGFSGSAALPPGDTMMYAVNRVKPSSKDWYYGYLGSYKNGFVPAAWSGDIYFGSAITQKYDVFVYVMSVGQAGKFWNAHKSSDGSFAFGTAAPAGVRPAAHVRVTQGSLDEC